MVRPKKHLGQHFLTDQNIAREVVESLSYPVKNLLEIGPGTGILTRILLEKSIGNFGVVEVDPESVSHLRHEFPEMVDQVIEADFLTFNLETFCKDRLTLIGNFPYNISSQILFRVLHYRQIVDEVVGMFQKEVAERIASPPGSKSYGILSVLLQAFYRIEYLFTVGKTVFHPPPNVQSAVIRLQRNENESLECNEELFFEVVKTAFNQRRKMLRNSLGKYTFYRDDQTAVLLQKRAEQLSVTDFVHLTNAIK